MSVVRPIHSFQRMAVKSEYGEFRAVSIIYPVLKGRKYRVGAYCTDSATSATVLFVPLEN